MNISSIDLAYIAGFFDGEGCVSGIHASRSGYASTKVSINQRRPETLYWIKKTLKMGKVYVFSRGYSNWVITKKEDIERFIALILPYSQGKKKQLIVGRELNNLVGLKYHVSENNRQERLILADQLKVLKRDGGIHEKDGS